MGSHSTQKRLYFIALIPPDDVQEPVTGLKEEMKARYGSSHALKSPPHITLQMPFRRPEAFEGKLAPVLECVAMEQKDFRVILDGFDCFAPRVIFVRVANHEPIIALHERLSAALPDTGLEPREITARVHPHMTIATRDLNETCFHRAWREFERRSFKAGFRAEALYLLKHNGRCWDPYMAFPFGIGTPEYL